MSDLMEALAALANDQRVAEVKIDDLTEQLEKAKEELKRISEKLIPEVMDELDLTLFKTKEGIEIEIEEKVHTSVTKKNQPRAYQWLEDNGYGAIVKNQIIIAFERGEEELAEKVVDTVSEDYDDLNVKVTKTAAAPSINKFVRESLEDGKDIPLELFGVHQRTVSKISVK